MRLHLKGRVPTRVASLKQHDPCVYRTCIQSLLLQFSSIVHWLDSTLAQADDCLPLIQSTPTTSSEHWGGLDCVSRYSLRSFLAASKGFTVHSRRPYSRQNQAQSISNDCQSNHENSTRVQSISKSVPVNHGISKTLEGVL